MNWPVVKLGDRCDILSGFAFKSDLFSSNADGIPLIRIRDVLPGYSSTFYSGEYDDKFIVHDGEILIGMDGDFNRARWNGGKALLNQRVCKISGKDGLDSGYLFHLLPDILQVIADRTPFVTVKHLSAKDLREYEIPLPPLPEQKRIAGILDQADALRRLRARALEKLNTLGQAIFQEMFGEPMEEWPEVSISHITRDARTGPFGSQLLVSEFTDTGIPVLGIDNVVQNKFAWAKERYITKHKYEQLKRYQVKPGDVLVTIMGTCGRCAVVPEGIGRAINTKHICCLTPIDTLVRSIFLQSALIWDRSILLQLGVESKGAIMPGLNMGKIVNLKIRLPPIGKQELFAERIRLISEQTQKLEHSQVGASSLFTSLQHRAFRGEL